MTGDAFKELNEAVRKIKAAGYSERSILKKISQLKKMKQDALKPEELSELEETLKGYYEIAALFKLQKAGDFMKRLEQKIDELLQRHQSQQPDSPE